MQFHRTLRDFKFTLLLRLDVFFSQFNSVQNSLLHILTEQKMTPFSVCLKPFDIPQISIHCDSISASHKNKDTKSLTRNNKMKNSTHYNIRNEISFCVSHFTQKR